MSQPTFSRRPESASSVSSQQPPVAAIIRPLAAVEGTNQTARVDMSQPIRAPHRRPQQLESYVSWLQQRSLQDLNDEMNQEANGTQTNGRQAAQRDASVTQQMNSSSGHPSSTATEPTAKENGGWSFIRIPREDQLFASSHSQARPQATGGSASPAPRSNSNPSLLLPSTGRRQPAVQIVDSKKENSDHIHLRNDSGHHDLLKPASPQTKTGTSSIHLDSDLRRILEKLDQVSTDTSELNTLTEDHAIDNSQQHQQRASMEDISRAAQYSRPQAPARKVHPAEFAQPYQVEITGTGTDGSWKEESQRAQQPINRFGQTSAASSDHTDAVDYPAAASMHGSTPNQLEVIQAVSKAIASVLTEQNESLIELKIKERLSQLQLANQNSNADSLSVHAPAVTPISQSDAQEKGSEQSIDPPSITRFKSVNETKGHDTIKRNRDVVEDDAHSITQDVKTESEIPSEVAAWDVPDFRWPEISNQMLSVGATAIESLGNAVMQSVKQKAQHRVGVTACDRSSGTTSISISLARWAAAKGMHVLLVDADLEKPELTKTLGLGSDINWMAVPGLGKPLDLASEKIIRAQNSKICLMPLASSQQKSLTARLRYQHLIKLIDQVVDRFDLILFDFGPAEQILAELIQANQLIESAILLHQQKSPELLQLQHQLAKIGVDKFVLAQNSAQSGAEQQAA